MNPYRDRALRWILSGQQCCFCCGSIQRIRTDTFWTSGRWCKNYMAHRSIDLSTYWFTTKRIRWWLFINVDTFIAKYNSCQCIYRQSSNIIRETFMWVWLIHNFSASILHGCIIIWTSSPLGEIFYCPCRPCVGRRSLCNAKIELPARLSINVRLWTRHSIIDGTRTRNALDCRGSASS